MDNQKLIQRDMNTYTTANVSKDGSWGTCWKGKIVSICCQPYTEWQSCLILFWCFFCLSIFISCQFSLQVAKQIKDGCITQCSCKWTLLLDIVLRKISNNYFYCLVIEIWSGVGKALVETSVIAQWLQHWNFILSMAQNLTSDSHYHIFKWFVRW